MKRAAALFFVAMAVSLSVSSEPLSLAYGQEFSVVSPMDVQFSLENDMLVAIFKVEASKINAKEFFGPKDFPFQHDVVEVFVSVSQTHLPYFEFELSPFYQEFELKIIDPKKQMINDVHIGVTHSAERVQGRWTARLAIPLKNLGWNGDPKEVYGNAYAILGVSPKRNYWSLFQLNETKPNFHLPQYFKPLL